MLFASLLKHNYLLNNRFNNNFKKNLYSIVNAVHKSDFDNEYVNIYINKNQLKTVNSTCCKYCKGTGWIIWKTNNNLYDLKLNKSSASIYSYSLCYKCI